MRQGGPTSTMPLPASAPAGAGQSIACMSGRRASINA
jgi:hypothetical protein